MKLDLYQGCRSGLLREVPWLRTTIGYLVVMNKIDCSGN